MILSCSLVVESFRLEFSCRFVSFDVQLLMHAALSSSEMHCACVAQLLLGQCSSDYRHSNSTLSRSPNTLVTTSFDDPECDLVEEDLEDNSWFAHQSFYGSEHG